MRQEVTRAHKGWALDVVALHNDVTKYSLDEIKAPPAVSNDILRLYLKFYCRQIKCLLVRYLAYLLSRFGSKIYIFIIFLFFLPCDCERIGVLSTYGANVASL